ncbi:hypothetical protein D6C99_10401 [Aureobasidium pullulans]|nr:hypothetical protein D6C99_10401 [Aureobasidium pullulans]
MTRKTSPRIFMPRKSFLEAVRQERNWDRDNEDSSGLQCGIEDEAGPSAVHQRPARPIDFRLSTPPTDDIKEGPGDEQQLKPAAQPHGEVQSARQTLPRRPKSEFDQAFREFRSSQILRGTQPEPARTAERVTAVENVKEGEEGEESEIMRFAKLKKEAVDPPAAAASASTATPTPRKRKPKPKNAASADDDDDKDDYTPITKRSKVKREA